MIANDETPETTLGAEVLAGEGFQGALRQVREKWSVLSARGNRVLMVFSEGSVFWDMFRLGTEGIIRDIFPPNNLTVAMHKKTDHTFTLISSQQALSGTVSAWLERNGIGGERMVLR